MSLKLVWWTENNATKTALDIASVESKEQLTSLVDLCKLTSSNLATATSVLNESKEEEWENCNRATNATDVNETRSGRKQRDDGILNETCIVDEKAEMF